MRFIKTILLGLCAFGLSASLAIAAPDDEAFVQQKANEALAVLSDATLDQTTKSQRFSRFVDEVTDVRRVARFVLGKYARGADPQKVTRFTEVFRQYASGVYESQLGKFGGETLSVTGSQDRKPGDSVVTSVISGGQLDDPIDVKWRIRSKNGVKKVLDVQVFGIWLALQQRNEITAVIANHNGDIEAAITILNNKIANQEFGDPGGNATSQ